MKKLFNWVAMKQMEHRFANKEVPLQEKDPVIQDMQDFAQKRGLYLRVHKVVDGIVTSDMSLSTERVNAYIEKAKDGKWRVSKNFDIG